MAFIQKISDYITSHYDLTKENITIVFPNKRAALQLRTELAKTIKTNFWVPQILSIQQAMEEWSGLQLIDNIEVIFEIIKMNQEFFPYAAQMAKDFDEIDQYGVNAEKLFSHLKDAKEIEEWNLGLENGVEFTCLDGVIIEREVEIGKDTEILPGTILRGKTKIGARCKIGPNVVIENSTVGDETIVNTAQIYDSEVAEGVNVGPFVHIRPDCHIGKNAKIGDFVEVKNSSVGEKTAIAHLAYIGDSIFDLMIKDYFVRKVNMPTEKYHKVVTGIVKAVNQAMLIDKLVEEEKLTENELEAFKHGRNSSVHTKAKNATMGEYKKATGFEAVLGFNYLTGNKERLEYFTEYALEAAGYNVEG